MASPTADQYRARAASLRSQARALDNSRFLTLHLRTGDDVWIGPTAVAFRSDFSSAAHHVRLAIAELRDAARALDQQAIAAESAGLVGNRVGAGW